MENKETIADSSIWIAYLFENDSQHKKAREIIDSLVAPIIPEYILLEVTTVLRQKKRELEASLFIALATQVDTYLPAGNLGIEIASCYCNKKYQELSFVDVGLVLLAKNYNVITFDHSLQKAIKQERLA